MSARFSSLADLPRHLQGQAAAQMHKKPLAPMTVKASSPSFRQKQSPMNKLETEFFNWLLSAYPSKDYRIYQAGVSLKLGNGVRYTPDFNVVSADGWVNFEVKGGHFWDDAKVKLKIAASEFPHMKFWLVTKASAEQGGGWNTTEVMQ